MFSPSSSSSSLLVSPLSISDTGSVLIFGLVVELDVVVAVCSAGLACFNLRTEFSFRWSFLVHGVFRKSYRLSGRGSFSCGINGFLLFALHVFQLLFSFLQLRLSRCVLFLQLLCLFKVFIHKVREALVSHRSLCFHGVGDCPNYLMLRFYVFLITIAWDSPSENDPSFSHL